MLVTQGDIAPRAIVPLVYTSKEIFFLEVEDLRSTVCLDILHAIPVWKNAKN